MEIKVADKLQLHNKTLSPRKKKLVLLDLQMSNSVECWSGCEQTLILL